MPGPLEGYRILDLSAVVSGPLATMILADQGADVIKVEAPGFGDIVRYAGPNRGGMTATFAVINRNKRSLAVNLKDDRGLAVVHDLARQSDVVVQNFRPGVTDRMHLGYEDLRALKDDIIYVSISGFGDEGPYSQQRVYDPIIQAISGMAVVQQQSDSRQPDLVKNIVCDKVTSYTVAQGVTAALLARERGRGGQHLKLSMLDAAIAFLWPDGMVRQTLLGDGVADTPTLSDVYSLNATSDGFMTSIAISDAEFAGMARGLGRPELADDPRFATLNDRISNFEAMQAEFEGALTSMTTEEVVKRLGAEDVPSAALNTPDEVADDPQVIANGTLVESENPTAGRMRQPRPPMQFTTTPADIRRHAPALGEHNDEILAELGRDASQIAALREAGVIG